MLMHWSRMNRQQISAQFIYVVRMASVLAMIRVKIAVGCIKIYLMWLQIRLLIITVTPQLYNCDINIVTTIIYPISGFIELNQNVPPESSTVSSCSIKPIPSTNTMNSALWAVSQFSTL